MTQAPETGAKNRLHFSGAGFWNMCHTHLGSDSSGTRNRRQIEHCSISKPETSVRITLVAGYCLFLSFPVNKV